MKGSEMAVTKIEHPDPSVESWVVLWSGDFHGIAAFWIHCSSYLDIYKPVEIVSSTGAIPACLHRHHKHASIERPQVAHHNAKVRTRQCVDYFKLQQRPDLPSDCWLLISRQGWKYEQDKETQQQLVFFQQHIRVQSCSAATCQACCRI